MVDIVDIQVSLATRRTSATTWPDQMTIHKSAGSSRRFAGKRSPLERGRRGRTHRSMLN
jgi:hypothetical protein